MWARLKSQESVLGTRCTHKIYIMIGYYVSGAGSHLLYIIMTRLTLLKRWWRLEATTITNDASVGDLKCASSVKKEDIIYF